MILSELPSPPLDPLPYRPTEKQQCTCGHNGNDHSHILYDCPCLECDCFEFMWDGKDREMSELVRRFPALAERINPRRW